MSITPPEFNQWYIGDHPPCTCHEAWNGVTPRPPCLAHPYVTWPIFTTTAGVVFTTTEEEPAYDGPTEEFVLTLGLTPGYGEHKPVKKRQVIGDFLKSWQAHDGLDSLPVRVSVERVGYPGGEEDVLVVTGTRNPYWMSDPVEWRKQVLYRVRQLKDEYQQSTAQVTFSPTHLVYYRTESP